MILFIVLLVSCRSVKIELQWGEDWGVINYYMNSLLYTVRYWELNPQFSLQHLKNYELTLIITKILILFKNCTVVS